MKKLILPLAMCAGFAALADIPAVTPCTRDIGWWLPEHTNRVNSAKGGGAPIVFIGDSITQYWGHPDRGRPVWRRYFAEGPYKAANLGVSGDRTEHILWRIRNGELDGFEAKLVVLMAGINNIAQRPFSDEPPSDTIIGIKTLLDEVRRRQPKAKVVLHPVFPAANEEWQRRADVVNAELHKFCDGFDVIWCDFNDRLTLADGSYPATVSHDGIHPKGIGYEIWAAALLPYVRAALAGGDMPPSLFPSRQTQSTTAGCGRAGAVVTPQTGMEYRDYWFPRLRAHRRAIAENAGRKYDVVFCGDSITHLWEAYGKAAYAEVTNRFSVLNLGYCGDGVEHLLWRLKYGEGQGYKAKLFMVMIGTNNAGDPEKHVTTGIVNVVRTIRELHPESKVLLLPIFPRGEKAGNAYRVKNAGASEAARKALADDTNVVWFDFNDRFLLPDGTLPKAMFGDFLHPNKDGYRIWLDAVTPYFEKYAR